MGMTTFVEGPREQAWQAEKSGTVCRKGYWIRARTPSPAPMPLEAIFNLANNGAATELAARLNRLDAVEAALRGLCAAVEAERKADREWLDDLNGQPLVGTPRLKAAEQALIDAEQAAREVLQ